MTRDSAVNIGSMVVALWLSWAALANWLMRSGPRRGDPLAGLVYRLVQLYARTVHRLRVEGFEHLPSGTGPLIVVANHTAGVDPVLVQAAVPFEVRWLMAKDMMLPRLAPLWEWVGVIGVSRDGADSNAARHAMRHLAASGVIGMYPEGGIERPRRRVLPFAPGIGLIIAKSRAPVLQVIIDGTPYARTAWGSLLRPSRTTIRFLPIKQYEGTGMKPAEIAADLRARVVAATGWPENNTPSRALTQG